jgi:hypothetical protein
LILQKLFGAMDLPLLNLSDESSRAQVPARSAIMPLIHFSATPARLIERQLPSYVSYLIETP